MPKLPAYGRWEKAEVIGCPPLPRYGSWGSQDSWHLQTKPECTSILSRAQSAKGINVDNRGSNFLWSLRRLNMRLVIKHCSPSCRRPKKGTETYILSPLFTNPFGFFLEFSIVFFLPFFWPGWIFGSFHTTSYHPRWCPCWCWRLCCRITFRATSPSCCLKPLARRGETIPRLP